MHARAQDILRNQATLRSMSDENAAYVLALLDDSDLTPWHSKPSWWRAKQENTSRKHSPAVSYDPIETSAYEMASTAWCTCQVANGQEVMRRHKEKDFRFDSLVALWRT
jgi:hypothetical protein